MAPGYYGYAMKCTGCGGEMHGAHTCKGNMWGTTYTTSTTTAPSKLDLTSMEKAMRDAMDSMAAESERMARQMLGEWPSYRAGADMAAPTHSHQIVVSGTCAYCNRGEYRYNLVNGSRVNHKCKACDRMMNIAVDGGRVTITTTSHDSKLSILGLQKETSKNFKPRMSLSAIAKRLLDKDTNTLVKAGYLDSELDLTEKGQEALDAILFSAHKDELVKLAEAEITEAKDSK